MNIEQFQPMLDWIAANQELSYCIIFLLSLSESLVVVGLVVPGIAIMSIIGAFIGTGHLGLWPTMIAAVLGAIIGDGLSYWVGQRFQQGIRGWWVFRKFPETIMRCEKFFAKHGGISVVIGRFVGPVRPMIPVIAGMMKMPPGYFYTVNIISALLWAPVYLLPGYLFGNTLNNLPPEISTKILYIVVITIVSIWTTIKFIQSIIYALKRRYRKIGTQLWLYVENNSIYYLQKIIKHPLTHKKHQVDSFLFLLTLLLVTVLFIFLTKWHILVTSLNGFFKHLSLLLFNPSFAQTLLYIDINSSIISLSALYIIFCAYFYFTHKYTNTNITTSSNTAHTSHSTSNTSANNSSVLNRFLMLSLGLLFFFYLTFLGISYLLHYPKPFKLDYDFTSRWFNSFPNLSLGLLTLLFGYIGIIKYCNNPKLYKRSNFNFLAISTITLFAIVKLFIGYTWLSDLLGALLVSGCILLVFCIIYWQHPLEKINIKQLKKFSLLAVLVVFLSNISTIYFNANVKAYNIKRVKQNLNTIAITQEQWLNQNNQSANTKIETIPESQLRLFDNTIEPIINIQWLANKRDLIKILKANNWQKQSDFNFENMLKLLENQPNITKMPLVPHYYQDHHSSIVLFKLESNNKILSLRLWESEYTINNKTVWAGTVQYMKPKKYFNTFTVLSHWPEKEFANSVNVLEQDLKTLGTLETLGNKNILNTKIISSNHLLIDEKLKIILIY